MFILVIEQIAKTREKIIGTSICDILRDLVPLVQDADTSFKKGLMELGSIVETSFEIYLNNLQLPDKRKQVRISTKLERKQVRISTKLEEQKVGTKIKKKQQEQQKRTNRANGISLFV